MLVGILVGAKFPSFAKLERTYVMIDNVLINQIDLLGLKSVETICDECKQDYFFDGKQGKAGICCWRQGKYACYWGPDEPVIKKCILAHEQAHLDRDATVCKDDCDRAVAAQYPEFPTYEERLDYINEEECWAFVAARKCLRDEILACGGGVLTFECYMKYKDFLEEIKDLMISWGCKPHHYEEIKW